MLIYAKAIARCPEARSLHAEDLFNAPAPAITAAAAHFRLDLSRAEAESIAAGELFQTHSKSPNEKFGNAERLALQASIGNALEPEFARVRAWIETVPALGSLPERLDRPLVAPSPLLLDI
jgi:hypothetical protein